MSGFANELFKYIFKEMQCHPNYICIFFQHNEETLINLSGESRNADTKCFCKMFTDNIFICCPKTELL